MAYQTTTETIVKSSPVPVYWCGWHTTTTELQRSGWNIYVAQDAGRFGRLAFGFVHPQMRLESYSEPYEMDHLLNRADLRFLPGGNQSEYPPIVINFVAPMIKVQTVQVDHHWEHKQWHAIDAEPQMVEQKAPKSFKDFLPFVTRAETPDTHEVYLESQADMTVLDHLQAIKDLQAPKQAEIREKKRRQSAVEKPQEIRDNVLQFKVIAPK